MTQYEIKLNDIFHTFNDSSVAPLPEMKDRDRDETYMRMALAEALRAGREGEVPVGAILIAGDRVLARNHNRSVQRNDPTAHAEILVLRRSGKALRNYRLNGTVLYVTVEPCPMCASAMVHGRVSRLVFGAREPKSGAVASRFRLLRSKAMNHRVEVDGGILQKECAEALRAFFQEKRTLKEQGRKG